MGPAAITEGQAALTRGDWARARSVFAAALEQDETPEALYGLARAVEWAGDYRAAIDLYGRAYAAFRARGESRTPALIAARELSFLYAAVYGNAAAASGWIERARRLALTTGDCVERGWVALAEALMTDDPDEKAGHVRTAIDIAQRLGDSDLAMCAIANEGVCLVLKGHFTEG
ncbi:MAG: tetratricopeptide repeat protein, partial [Acidimicrobiales bacterium]